MAAPSKRRREPVPRRVGPYAIVKKLGAGGMGTVYRARDPDSGREVAVKTVRATGAGQLSSLRREVHALSRLDHPGIVKVLRFGEERGLPWYAMELLDGRSLGDVLGELHPARPGAMGHARLPVAGGRLVYVLTMARRLCAALGYLHGEGILHRDLKPGNILIRKGGWPSLIDFGLAVSLSGASGRETVEEGTAGLSGTISYMAPEQILGDLIDSRADLYALGCILHELLTGRPPYVGEQPMEVLNAHLEGCPPPLATFVDGVPEALDALTARLLERDPAMRYSYADDVARDLIALGADADLPVSWPRARDHLFRPAFAGRESALHTMRAKLSSTRTGSGGLVLVAGESGVGKSRFALEVVRRAERRKHSVLLGACLPSAAQRASGDGAEAQALTALRAPLQAIVDRCRVAGKEVTQALFGPSARVLLPYLPTIARLPGVDRRAALPELAPQAARLRLMDALTRVFSAAASQCPTLLVLDDTQWADDLSLGFLDHLVKGDHLAGLPLVVLATYRSDESGPEIEALAASAETTTIALGRLGEQAVDALVESMLARTAPPALTAFVRRHSEGVPFFVAEYLRAAVAEGFLCRSEGRWQVVGRDGEASYETLATPGPLRFLGSRRLRGLPRACQTLVSAAAVLGRELDAELLEAIVELPPADYLEALSELMRRQILTESIPGRYRFEHDKIREAAYEQIDRQRAVGLHGAAAAALEAGTSSDDPRDADLAFHYERADQPERARAHYYRAAVRARETYALGASARLYARYLALTPEPNAEALVARLDLGGQVLATLWRMSEAEQVLAEGIEQARALRDAEAEIDLQLALGVVLTRSSQHDKAERTLEAGLTLARRIGDRRRQGEALSRSAALVSVRGEPQAALPLSLTALELAELEGNVEVQPPLLSTLCVIYRDLGMFDESREAGERAAALARKTGMRAILGVTLARLAFLLRQQGRLAEAVDHSIESLEITREVGDIFWEAISLGNMAAAERDVGLLDDAEHHYQESLRILRGVGDRYWLEVTRGNSAEVLLDQGRLEEAEDTLTRALDGLEALDETLWRGVHLGNLAAVRWAQGRTAESRDLYTTALGIAREQGNRVEEPKCLLGVARLDGDEGRPTSAEQLVADAQAIYEIQHNDLGLALCRVEAGLIAEGDQEGRTHLQRATDLADAIGVTRKSFLAQRLHVLRARLEGR